MSNVNTIVKGIVAIAGIALVAAGVKKVYNDKKEMKEKELMTKLPPEYFEAEKKKAEEETKRIQLELESKEREAAAKREHERELQSMKLEAEAKMPPEYFLAKASETDQETAIKVAKIEADANIEAAKIASDLEKKKIAEDRLLKTTYVSDGRRAIEAITRAVTTK